MFKVLREENEVVLKLKGLCPDNKLPKGILLEGGNALQNALSEKDIFEQAKMADKLNESREEIVKNRTTKNSSHSNSKTNLKADPKLKGKSKK